jgi:hypothetical protein
MARKIASRQARLGPTRAVSANRGQSGLLSGKRGLLASSKSTLAPILR